MTVPTFIESGVTDFDINSWVGLLAPAKTPRAVVDKLNTELNAVLNDPAVRDRLNTLGITASPGGPERFGRVCRVTCRSKRLRLKRPTSRVSDSALQPLD